MTFKSIEFALVVLQISMLKVYGIFGISKIVFLNFSGTERFNIYFKVVYLRHNRTSVLVSSYYKINSDLTTS